MATKSIIEAQHTHNEIFLYGLYKTGLGKRVWFCFSNPNLFVKNLKEFFPNVRNKCWIPDESYIKYILPNKLFIFHGLLCTFLFPCRYELSRFF